HCTAMVEQAAGKRGTDSLFRRRPDGDTIAYLPERYLSASFHIQTSSRRGLRLDKRDAAQFFPVRPKVRNMRLRCVFIAVSCRVGHFSKMPASAPTRFMPK